MKKKRLLVIMLLTSMLTLAGCGGDNQNTIGYLSNNTKDYTANLEDGVYYVRTNNTNVCTPIYFGEATFEVESIKNAADNSRVMWFKEDFEKVPTLYEGDSLIYFTKSNFEEKMTFERFKDLGYTIGICGMEELKSGRYSISTDVEDKCTYPNSDTDTLLTLTNSAVTLDTIGGMEIRAAEEDDSLDSFLSEHGTILGLEKGNTYEVAIYDGTVEHKYNFVADVKALGSFEVEENYNYEFESEYLINIPIPESFNSGYYLINGMGMFRYVKGGQYDDDTNFNIPNIYKDETQGYEPRIEVEENPSAEEETDGVEELQSSFTVTSPGQIRVEIVFTIPGDASTASCDGITAMIETPEGGNLIMADDVAEGVLYRTFDATVGDYTITYYDLEDRVPHVDVNPVYDSDMNSAFDEESVETKDDVEE